MSEIGHRCTALNYCVEYQDSEGSSITTQILDNKFRVIQW